MAREITKQLTDITWDLDGYNLDEVIAKLQEIKKSFGQIYPEYKFFKISVESERECYGDGEYPRVYLYGVRDETQEEEELRTGKVKLLEKQHFQQIRQEAIRLGIIKDDSEL